MDYKQIISDLINIEGTSKEEIYSYLLGLTKGEKKALQEIINEKLHRWYN